VLLLTLIGTCISFTFLNPFSHQATLMVVKPGGYSSATVMRFGIPLTLVSLSINDEQRDREIRDDRATLYTSFRRFEGNPVYVSFASSFATRHGGVHIFDRVPATRIAIDRLWEDLEELKFLNGSPPNRL
jgi:hypothetical protein